MVLGSYYLTMDRMGKAEKGAETIWCEDAGDTALTAQSVVDAEEFLAENAKAKAEGKQQATYRPLCTTTPAKKRPSWPTTTMSSGPTAPSASAGP